MKPMEKVKNASCLRTVDLNTGLDGRVISFLSYSVPSKRVFMITLAHIAS